MTQSKKVDRSYVNGVEVIAVEFARGVVIPGQAESNVSSVEKVLLADDSTWFRCFMKPTECEYANDNLKSVLSHQRSHSPIIELRKLQVKQAQTLKNRQNGAKKAAATRVRRRTEKPSTVDPTPNPALTRIHERLDEATTMLAEIRGIAGKLAGELARLNVELDKIPAAEAVDPAIIEKASRYDALKGLINN